MDYQTSYRICIIHANESILSEGSGSWSFIIHYRTVTQVTCISVCILLVRCVWHMLILTGLWCWKWLIEPSLSLNTSSQAHVGMLQFWLSRWQWAAGSPSFSLNASSQAHVGMLQFWLSRWQWAAGSAACPLGSYVLCGWMNRLSNQNRLVSEISAEKSTFALRPLSSVLLGAGYYYIGIQKNLPPETLLQCQCHSKMSAQSSLPGTW
jgi:hypothetical protein